MNFQIKLLVSKIFILLSIQAINAQNVILETNLNEMNEVVSFLSKDAFEKHITTLSSEKMKGRCMIEGGDKLAADYIKSFYDLNKIPTYNQERTLPFSVFVPQFTKFKIYNKNAILSKDHFGVLPFFDKNINEEIEVLYIDQINFKNLYRRYIRDKGIVFHRFDFFDEKNDIKLEDLDAKILFSVRDNEYNLHSKDFRSIEKSLPLRYLDKTKHEQRIKQNPENELWVNVGWSSILSLFSEEQQAMISRFNTLKKKEQKTLKTKVNIEIEKEILEYENEHILAYIEGSELKDEIILVNSNYDGIGIQKGIVFNGANANGTGSAAVMELALAFQKAKQHGFSPKRSILFVNFTANEPVGSIGEYFFCEYSGLPIENIVANFSFQSLGRKNSNVKDDKYCYLLGTDIHSSSYQQVMLETAKTYEKDLKILTSTAMYDYFRVLKGPLVHRSIPTTILTDNCNEDLFTPTDDIEKIDFELVYKRTKLGMKLIWEMANRSDVMEKDLFVPNKNYPKYY